MNSVKNQIIDYLRQKGCIDIKQRGTEIVSSCPIHKNKHNGNVFCISTIYPHPYKCFSCHAHGKLSDFNNGDIEYNFVDGPDNLIDMYKQLLDGSFTDVIPKKSSEIQPIIKYLRTRNIDNPQQIIDKYRLFYCSDGKYKKRMIMPIIIGNHIVGYNNRAIYQTKLKTLNAKNSKWGNYLYGLQSYKPSKVCILCEGSIDVLKISDAVQNNMIEPLALMGTIFNNIREELILQNFEKVILYLDADDAGDKASVEIYEQLEGKCEVEYAPNYMFCKNDAGESSKEEINSIIANTDIGAAII